MDKFHLIGIKGTGMSALAGILKDLGHEVSGSDVEENFFTSKKLADKVIKITNFSKDNISDDCIYISSSCYGEENVEVMEVKRRNLNFYYYHEFIEYYFNKTKIGISGAHGKTTTTSLIAKFFEDEKVTCLIGDGTGCGKIDYDYFIFEACEYKNHFLKYTYDYLVINNIDHDHPDFFKSIDDVLISFQKAADNSNCIIINKDDEYCNKIKHPNIISFGMNDADITGEIVEEHISGYILKVKVINKNYKFYLPFPGIHMIYNFLAAIAVCYINNLDLDSIQQKLLNYQKPSRRMEEYYYFDNIIIDDYAHHPKEIKMCLEAIKQKYPNKEILVIFQPHTYTRTLALQNEFKTVFNGVNLYIAKTFASKREAGDKELDLQVLNVFPNAKVFHKKEIKNLKMLHNNVILFLGAGNINKYISEFL